MSTSEKEDALLKGKDVMNRLQISRLTLYRWIEKGEITGHKVGNTWRFYESDVQAKVIEQSNPKSIKILDGCFRAPGNQQVKRPLSHQARERIIRELVGQEKSDKEYWKASPDEELVDALNYNRERKVQDLARTINDFQGKEA